MAIKHADTELDCFIASNQLEESIMTSLVARKTLWDTTGRMRAMTGSYGKYFNHLSCRVVLYMIYGMRGVVKWVIKHEAKLHVNTK